MNGLRLATLLIYATIIGICGCGTSQKAQSGGDFSVEGEIRRVGNEPFSRLVLTTDQRNSYVLEFDRVSEPQRDMGRYRVSGRLHGAEWNGERVAHVAVVSLVPVGQE